MVVDYGFFYLIIFYYYILISSKNRNYYYLKIVVSPRIRVVIILEFITKNDILVGLLILLVGDRYYSITFVRVVVYEITIITDILARLRILASVRLRRR